MKKMLFIMNPFAGVKRANRHLADILLTFTQAGYEVITHMTLGRGDATAVAREKGKDVDLVVCCGGDGTLNETITGLLSAGADTHRLYPRRFHQRLCFQPEAAHQHSQGRPDHRGG